MKTRILSSLAAIVLLASSVICSAGQVVELKTKQDVEKALFHPGKAVLLFSASWCGPCQLFHPVYEKLATDLKVPFYTVDIDNPELAGMSSGAPSIPAVLVFLAAEVPKGLDLSVCPVSLGYQDYAQERAQIEKCLAKGK